MVAATDDHPTPTRTARCRYTLGQEVSGARANETVSPLFTAPSVFTSERKFVESAARRNGSVFATRRRN